MDEDENVEPKTWRDYSPMVLFRKHPTKVIGSLIIWGGTVLVSIVIGAVDGSFEVFFGALGITTVIWLVVNLIIVALQYFGHNESETHRYGERINKNW